MTQLIAIEEFLVRIGAQSEAGCISRRPEAWYHPGSHLGKGKSLVIAGIHGNEYSAKALGKAVIPLLMEQSPTFETLLLPSYSHSTSRRGIRCKDLNREYGRDYQSRDPHARWLAQLITGWHPDRILSIHSDSILQNAGIYTDPVRPFPDLSAFRRKLEAKAKTKSSGTKVYWQGRRNSQRSKLCWNDADAWVRTRLGSQLPMTAWADRAFYPDISTPAAWASAFAGDERNSALMTLVEQMIDSDPVVQEACTGNRTTASRPHHQKPDGTQSAYSLLYPSQGTMQGGISLGEWCSAIGISTVTIEVSGKQAAANWQAFLPALRRFLEI